MGLVKYIVRKHPKLAGKLKVAHELKTPEEYIKQLLFTAFMYTIAVMIFFFMIATHDKEPNMLILAGIMLGSSLVMFTFFYKFLSLNLEAKIKRIEHDIDREVIYAGRFLLIKLESGTPFFNALIEGTKAHGVAGKYFKEIVDDINLGTPIEEALGNAMVLTPSDKFRKILFTVNNALRLGIDISTSLQSVITDLVNDQMNEIQAYSKKLGSIAMFYLLLAIVVPSLGLTVIVIVLSFMSIRLDIVGYGALIFIIFLIQMFFLSLFRSIRPNVAF